MPATSNVGPAASIDQRMTPAACRRLLRRTCFGHLSFLQKGHVAVVPIRYAFVDGWVYFRANFRLRAVIASSPWLALSVTELQDADHVSSVIARGGCYETEQTGTATDNAKAMRGIVALRDPATGGTARAPRVRRSLAVFRLHPDALSGVTVFVPCPTAGPSANTSHERSHA